MKTYINIKQIENMHSFILHSLLSSIKFARPAKGYWRWYLVNSNSKQSHGTNQECLETVNRLIKEGFELIANDTEK